MSLSQTPQPLPLPPAHALSALEGIEDVSKKTRKPKKSGISTWTVILSLLGVGAGVFLLVKLANSKPKAPEVSPPEASIETPAEAPVIEGEQRNA